MAYGGIVVFDGNSLTVGDGSTGGADYPAQVMIYLNPYGAYTKYNYGVGGQKTTDMAADAAAQIDILYSAGNAQNILVAWEVTNDLFFGASAATAYANIVSYCQARQAVGFQVVVLTVLPRSNVGTPGSFEADRQTVNTSIRANWSTFADALADVAADTRIGDSGDEINVAYYDGSLVHLGNEGYGVVADITAAAIFGLMGLTMLVLQPTAAASSNAFILATSATTNFGNNADHHVGDQDGGGGSAHFRSLLDMSLTALPDNAVISLAMFSLYAWLDASINARTFSIYRIMVPWVEAEVTWNKRNSSTNWETAGAFGATDCEQVALASRAMTATETLNVRKQFICSATTKAAMTLGYGWLHRAATEVSDLYGFKSPNAVVVSQTPKLIFVYALPSVTMSRSAMPGRPW